MLQNLNYFSRKSEPPPQSLCLLLRVVSSAYARAVSDRDRKLLKRLEPSLVSSALNSSQRSGLQARFLHYNNGTPPPPRHVTAKD